MESFTLRLDTVQFHLDALNVTDVDIKYNPKVSPCNSYARNVSNPILFGAIAVGYNLDQDERHTLLEFLGWVNGPRGGVCVGGERRSILLYLARDLEQTVVDPIMVQALVEKNVSFVVSMTHMQNTEDLIPSMNSSGMLVMSTTANNPVFANDSYPNMMTAFHSTKEELPPVFKMMNRSRVKQVVSLASDASSYQDMCADVPLLATTYGMTFLGNASVNEDGEDKVLIGRRLRAGFRALNLNASRGTRWGNETVLIVACMLHCKLLALAVDRVMFQDTNYDLGNFVVHCPQRELDPVSIRKNSELELQRFMTTSTAWNSERRFNATNDMELYAQNSQEWARKNLASDGSNTSKQSMAYTWVAAEALVKAIEIANSTDIADVRRAFPSLAFRSIVGLMNFSGMRQFGRFGSRNKVLMRQSQTETPMKEYTILSNGVHEPFVDIYPPPIYGTRFCHIEVNPTGDYPFGVQQYGYFLTTSGEWKCGACPQGVPVWNSSARYQQCQACSPGTIRVQVTVSTFAGDFSGLVCQSCADGSDIDGPCKAGSHQASLCNCDVCPQGTFSSTPGQTICKPCDAGWFAFGNGNTACKSCSPGTITPAAGMDSCMNCTLGWFSGNVSSTACSICSFGQVATSMGSKNCSMCEFGTVSNYAHDACDKCKVGQIGFYNERRGAADCKEGDEGGDFTEEGMIIAPNQDDYWMNKLVVPCPDPYFKTMFQLSWERCRSNAGSCLAGYRCARGHTGVLCKACLPGYATNSHSGMGCMKCPEFTANLVLTVLVVIATITVIVLSLVCIGAASVRKNLDQRWIIVKIGILYSFVSTTVFLDIGATISDNEERLHVGMRESLRGILDVITFFPGFSCFAETGTWSVSCLLAQADTNGLLQHFDTLVHYQWWEAEEQPWVNLLKAFQAQNEQRLIVFWIAWPFLIMIVTYIFLFFYVSAYLVITKKQHQAAEKFGMKALTQPEEAMKSSEAEVLTYLALSRFRILNIWCVNWFVNDEGFLGPWRCFVNFHSGVQPLFFTVAFVCYGHVLVNIIPIFACPVVGPYRVFQHASAISCDKQDEYDTFSHNAVLAFLAWGIAIPLLAVVVGCWRSWLSPLVPSLVVGRTLARATSPGSCAALWIGYQRQFNMFEVFCFAIKFLFVSIYSQPQVETRLIGGLILTLLYLSVFTIYQPLDSHKSPGAVISAKFLFVVVLVYLSFATYTFVELASLGVGSKVRLIDRSSPAFELYMAAYSDKCIFAALFFCLGLHVYFVVSLVSSLLNETFHAFVAGTMRTGKGPWARMMMAFENRAQKSKPYVSFETKTGWFTVMGSRADVGEAITVLDNKFIQSMFEHETTVEKRRGIRMEDNNFHLDPDATPEDAERDLLKLGLQNVFKFGNFRMYKAKKSLQHEALECIFRTIPKLASLPGSPTTSVSLVEFVIRATFHIAKRIKEEDHLVQYVHHGDSIHLRMTCEADAKVDKLMDEPHSASARMSTSKSNGKSATAPGSDTGRSWVPTRFSVLKPDGEDGMDGRFSVKTGPTPAEIEQGHVKRLVNMIRARHRSITLTNKLDSALDGETVANKASSAWTELTRLLVFLGVNSGWSKLKQRASADSGKTAPLRSSQAESKASPKTDGDQQQLQGEESLEGSPEEQGQATRAAREEPEKIDKCMPTSSVPREVSDALEAHTEDVLNSMFSESTFEWGIEFEVFKEAAARLLLLPVRELRMLLDGFEARWNRHNRLAAWTVKSMTNRIQVRSTLVAQRRETNDIWIRPGDQCVLEDPEEAEQQEEIGHLYSQDQDTSRKSVGRPRQTQTQTDGVQQGTVKKRNDMTRSELSWTRITMLARFGFPGQSSAANRPTLGDAARMLRMREAFRNQGVREEFEAVRLEYNKMKEERLQTEAELIKLKLRLGLPVSDVTPPEITETMRTQADSETVPLVPPPLVGVDA